VRHRPEAALHPDGLVLVFTRQDSMNSDLFVSTRATTANDFGNPVPLPAGTNPITFEYGPVWSHDSAQLTFRYDDGVATTEVRVIDYLGNGTFSTSYTLATMPGGSHSWEITPSGLEMFFTTVNPSLDNDLGHATRATLADPWVEDDDVLDLVFVGRGEGFPTYDAARGVLYYESDEPGGSVIMEARRPSPGARFEKTGPTGFLADQDGDPDISVDGLTLVFSSSRLGGGTENDIFLTTRSCL